MVVKISVQAKVLDEGKDANMGLSVFPFRLFDQKGEKTAFDGLQCLLERKGGEGQKVTS